MKLLYTLLFLCISSIIYGQSTAMEVYQIFQNKCVSCHGSANPEAGLDLEGEGATVAEKTLDVYNNLVNVTPANTFAASKGYRYVYPGRQDLSYLFRKINQDLEPTISLESEEGESQPPAGQPQLTEEEKELIRQWIFFGAPLNSNVVEEQVIADFYTSGLKSFPDGAPEVPAAGEGFQIKMGPFYLEPGGEVEYFQKYELQMPDDVEVKRIEILMSNYSHHMIIYNFTGNGGANIQDGFRLNPDHSQISLVAAVQEQSDIELPEKTAFLWDNDLVLDLNSHYINYSSGQVYQAEVYINVYTQPLGTALHEMHTELLINYDIPIPNNGNTVTHYQVVNPNIGEKFLWLVMGHTHQWGVGYKMYNRTPGGGFGDLFYDGSCSGGIPGCVSPYFDYQHIPPRTFYPLLPMQFGGQGNGFIQEAKWENFGPTPVNFGPTSDDEMMVTIMMYTDDTTGMNQPVISNVEKVGKVNQVVEAFPNPMSISTSFDLSAFEGEVEFTLFDMLGKTVRQFITNDQLLEVKRGTLESGIYFYRFENKKGQLATGKLVVD